MYVHHNHSIQVYIPQHKCHEPSTYHLTLTPLPDPIFIAFFDNITENIVESGIKHHMITLTHSLFCQICLILSRQTELYSTHLHGDRSLAFYIFISLFVYAPVDTCVCRFFLWFSDFTW